MIFTRRYTDRFRLAAAEAKRSGKPERDKVRKTIDGLADCEQAFSCIGDTSEDSNDLFVNGQERARSALSWCLRGFPSISGESARRNKILSAMVSRPPCRQSAIGILFLLVFIVPRFEAIFHDPLGDKRRRRDVAVFTL
jgi:hypothetical protein